ncbi:MAG: tetratricopeptide repeat protein [Alphaproteobacteria bacterium]|nr:tetratricopeptide repeat protein [Alphaproteobacteria bacterium]
MTGPVLSVAQTLQAALRHLQGGRPKDAEAVLQPLLAAGTTEPEVLNVAAAIARQTGRLDEAVALWRRSLASQQAQPRVHASVGHAQRAMGDLDGAKRSFEKAVTFSPPAADALLGLGLVLESLGEATEAETVLERAVAAAPHSGPALEALGALLTRLGRAAEGLAKLDAAARLAPASPTLPHNRGVALEAVKRDPEAAEAFAQAVARMPAQPASWFGLGAALRRLGDMEGAIRAYRTAIEIAPGFLEAHAELNETLWQAGLGGYLASYPMAIERMPQSPPLRRAFAHHLNRVRRHEEAEEQARAALSIQPQDAQSLDVLAQALAGQKRLEEAIDVFGLAEKAAAGDVRIAGRLAEAQLRAGHLEPAHDVLSRALAAAPHDQENLARLAIALRLLGEEAAHRVLADYDQFAQVIPVRPPHSYRDMAAFHADLAPYLLEKHQAKQHPTDQTLRGGTQTLGALFDDPHPLIGLLRRQLYEAVQGFVAGLPEDDRHPFLNRKREGFRFQGSWSVLLRRGGFHTNHIHPQGWISSAYYVTLPAEVSSEGDRQAWFKLGETNPDTCPVLPAERWIQPVEGNLILFPSYLWHGTQAFERGAERLTVAFDIVPG